MALALNINCVFLYVIEAHPSLAAPAENAITVYF